MPEEGIAAWWARRVDVGSCNACQRRDTMPVALIQLQTMSFRLCAECAESMKDILENLLSE